MGTRRQFSPEFKVEAVNLVNERGVSIAQAALDLDSHQTMLRTWIRELTADPQRAYPGTAAMSTERIAHMIYGM